MLKKFKENKTFRIVIIIILALIVLGAVALIVLGGNKNAGASGSMSVFRGTPGGGMAGGFGGGGKTEEASYAMVKTVNPVEGNVYVISSLTGTVKSSAAVYLYAQSSGDVTAVNKKVGDKVMPGDILCEVDTGTVESAKNSMESARISAEQARNNLARMEILYAGGDITEQEHEQYINSAKTSELQYNTAKANYEKQLQGSSVSAPIEGVVQSCGVEVNDRVNNNDVLYVIVGSGSKQINFFVSERIMNHLSVDDKMNAVKNGKTYPGKITSVNAIVDDATGLFECIAELDETDEIAIGSTVRIEITSDKAEKVLTVPVDSIYYSGGDAYLYTVVDNKAVMTPVEVGLYDDETAEILSGVSKEDTVISTWSNNLYEGANVRINDEEFDIDSLEVDDSKKNSSGGSKGGGQGGGRMGPM